MVSGQKPRVYVIGTAHNDEHNVMVADWLMQVSFKPRLVAVAFEEDATTLANVRGSRVFTVNVPSDFGSQRVVWQLRIRGKTYAVPGHLTAHSYSIEEISADSLEAGLVQGNLRDAQPLMGQQEFRVSPTFIFFADEIFCRDPHIVEMDLINFVFAVQGKNR